MSKVYIVYAKENRNVTTKLVELLSQQWDDVWWDKRIVGRFRQIIEKELPESACVIAVNSKVAREKATYAAELSIADKHKIPIIPIRLDDTDLPYPFGEFSHVDMQGWLGEPDHGGFVDLKAKIAQIVPPKGKPQRPSAIANGKLPLPSVFMSVSSYATQLKPADAVRVLRIFGAPAILVSAYDLISRHKRNPQDLIDEIHKYRDGGGFVLIDSGNYEKSRLMSKSWIPNKLEEAFAHTPHDWAFCFDVMRPHRKPQNAIDEILNAVIRDKLFTSSPVLPIVHAPKMEPGKFSLVHIPHIVCAISEKLRPPLIAIPERELGEGLIARAITVKLIREELNKLPYYQPLHILGTGNPWSLALLSAAGADTFDGLEWCRMAVDRSKNRLHHFQHYDLFAYQTELADSTIAREAYIDPKVDFAGKVAFHNLDYFCEFANKLREDISINNMEAFLIRITDASTTDQIKKQIPGIFK